MMHRATVPVLAILLLSFADSIRAADEATTYRVVGKYGIGGEGNWDDIALDGAARRLYVSHGDSIEVLDTDSGKSIGRIAAPRAHGVALAAEYRRGFTSNGGDSSVTIFDTETLKTLKKVSVSGTDFILYDPFTKRVFPLNEKITVLEAATGDKIGEVDLGGKPEAGISDGKGTLYINLEKKNTVAVVDAKALSVTKTFPLPSCTSPHSLSFDAANQRLFVGCRNGLSVLNVTNGKVVAVETRMCSDVDGGGFDPENQLIFESCGEGVISVIREFTPDYYGLIDTIKTQLRAKTMAFDPITKNIYLPTAEMDTVPNTDPKLDSPFRLQIVSGSFAVLVVSRK